MTPIPEPSPIQLSLLSLLALALDKVARPLRDYLSAAF
jgi:hypothetical protein